MRKLGIALALLALFLVGASAGASGRVRHFARTCSTVTTTVVSTVYSTITQTVTVTTGTTTAPPPPPPPPPPVSYFSQEPSGQCPRSGVCLVSTSLPQTDAYCEANVTPTTVEPRPAGGSPSNYPANSTREANPASVAWGPAVDPSYWANWGLNRNRVSGNYAGVTTQIIQWAACKWGIDEDTARAQAFNESAWQQYFAGDFANGCYHSFSIVQIRDTTNAFCPLNHNSFGGMPDTQNSTAEAMDFYGAYMRSCYDGDFYDSGSWLYGAQTVAQVAAVNGWDYVKWGCVGSWFSGGWYDAGAQSYITSVKAHLANRDWEKL